MPCVPRLASVLRVQTSGRAAFIGVSVKAQADHATVAYPTKNHGHDAGPFFTAGSDRDTDLNEHQVVVNGSSIEHLHRSLEVASVMRRVHRSHHRDILLPAHATTLRPCRPFG
jgi:hypothetical protein